MSQHHTSHLTHQEIEELSASLTELSKSSDSILSRLSEVVLGQDELLTELLIGLIAEGHLLLEGPPGVGKTFAR